METSGKSQESHIDSLKMLCLTPVCGWLRKLCQKDLQLDFSHVGGTLNT